ncbi:hypothetical protein RMATCC62417_06736 [Rhizopus microsporus]|nr:hypothetical protein RMATCC62417_06736 [Rhizopus microsporus]
MTTKLSKTAIDLLDQLILLLDCLNDDQFTYESNVMPASTIGKHLRHLCDHFQLLYQQLSSNTINYDIRQRDTPAENERSMAKKKIREIQETIKSNDHISLDTPVSLTATIHASDHEPCQFQSSFGRELFYCCIHAIHHYASIKAICIELGLSVPADFGVAPSTLQYNGK